MTFNDILEQVITLLKRQGRVSYGALKMRFDLDDEYLDILKIELIEAQRLAEDENDRILVWTGQVDETPALTSQPDQTSERPTAQHDPPKPTLHHPNSPPPTPNAANSP